MMNTNIDQTLTDFNDAFKALLEQAHRPVAQEITQFVEFRAKDGGTNNGKGLLWAGEGTSKQVVFRSDPNRIFISESLELGKDASLSIANTKVLDTKELGGTVVKSNLQQVGRLKGLVVDGSVNINSYLIYNATTDRLGIGTDLPNAALSVADQGIEVMIGTNESMHGFIGTFANNDLDIVTDNTSRISVKANGNIDLGNTNRNPIQVKINGKLAIGVNVPDPAVDLHVAGAVRFSGHIQMFASSPPSEGTYTKGDIVWNTEARLGKHVGWVCLTPGTPGEWFPFGKIEDNHF
jgi:hypothetical protein